MSNWQPIETAPKDGTVILLHDSHGYREKAVAGFYDKDEPDYPWRFLDGTSELNGWHDDLNGPTHWMPLPAPPKQEPRDE